MAGQTLTREHGLALPSKRRTKDDKACIVQAFLFVTYGKRGGKVMKNYLFSALSGKDNKPDLLQQGLLLIFIYLHPGQIDPPQIQPG